MINTRKKSICVVGGGLVGPMIGIMLAKQGYPVKLMEGRKDCRKNEYGSGRSINLSLSAKGFKALEQVGLKDIIRKLCIPQYGFMVHILNGPVFMVQTGKDGSEEANYCISRSDLNCALFDAAEATEGLEINFEHQCTRYDLKNNTLTFKNRADPTREEFELKDHLVIGSDGYNSVIRVAMQKETRIDYLRRYEIYGYKEITIPVGPDGKHMLCTEAIHVWPGPIAFAMGLPKQDFTYQFMFYLPHDDAEQCFSKLNTAEEITNFFKQNFPCVEKMIPDLVQQFQSCPIGEICTTKVFPWNYKDTTILMGDAAHGMTPFYGQGVNCGFESAKVLADMLEVFQDKQPTQAEWASLLKEFAVKRRVDSDAIQDLADQNFILLSKTIGDPFVVLKQQCEAMIAQQKPDFQTKDNQVAFSEIPYGLAEKRGFIHEDVLTELCKDLKDPSEFDVEKAYQMIKERYLTLAN